LGDILRLCKNAGHFVLIVGLSECLVSLFGLLLEKLQSPLKTLILLAVLGALTGGVFSLFEAGFELLDFAFEELVAVCKRGDLLFFG
jgi:hypothetical protein